MLLVDEAFWSLNVSDVRFVAFDTETTGVATTDHLVEIAAMSFDEEFDHRRFETLVKPPVPISPFATRIHGITDAMVAAAPGAAEAGARFIEFLGWVGNPRVLLAHNAAFDVGFMHRIGAAGLKRAGADASSSAAIVLDTCMLARALLPDLERHNLATVASHFRVKGGPAHRAMGDVITLHQTFLGLLGLAADRAAAVGGGLSLGALVDICGGYFVMDPLGVTDLDGTGVDARKGAFRLPARIAALEALCGGETRITIAYETEDDWRQITPMAFKRKGLRVYLEAMCHRDGVKKTFRADRIVKVRPAGPGATEDHPVQAALDESW